MKRSSVKPTARQRELHVYMTSYNATNGAPPSVREMADELGVASMNAVISHLKAMEKKGLVRHYFGRARGWVPV